MMTKSGMFAPLRQTPFEMILNNVVLSACKTNTIKTADMMNSVAASQMRTFGVYVSFIVVDVLVFLSLFSRLQHLENVEIMHNIKGD